MALFFGIANPARHRAFGDALATAGVLRGLLGRAQERGVTTLEELVDLHTRSRHGRHRRPRRPRQTGKGEPAASARSTPEPSRPELAV